MHALTDSDIRSSFVNASVRERKALTLPTNFDDLDWDLLDFLGWRDPKLPQVAYLVIPVDDRNVGIMLRLGGKKPRNRQLCSFCEDVQLPHEVVFYSARRAGSAGGSLIPRRASASRSRISISALTERSSCAASRSSVA